MIKIAPEVPVDAPIRVDTSINTPGRLWIYGVRRAITPGEARKLAAALIEVATEAEVETRP